MGRPISVKQVLYASQAAVGEQYDTQGHPTLTCAVVSTGDGATATIKFQGSPDGTNWIDLNTFSIVASGASYANVVNQYWPLVRANATSVASGAHTVYLNATGYAGIR